MVEFAPYFERNHDTVMADDYLDLTLFWRDPFNTILTQAGFKEIADHVGFLPDMNDIINEHAPPEARGPWRDEDYNWTAPETATAMWRILREAVQADPGRFSEWPGMIEEVTETLDIADRVFARAVAQNARWHITSPGF